MVRACCGVLVLAGVALALLLAGRDGALTDLGSYKSRKEKPYPYPVAYKFGFDYREESVKEDAWQARFHGRHLGVASVPAPQGGVALTQFYPRYPDTEEGAARSWRERRQASPFVYIDPASRGCRAPTDAEKTLEREGWVAGYLESARRHPARD